MRLLTKLKSLQAFEAAARHGSFVAAAAELGSTPAAVGQLVRSLEDWIGYPLLKRARSGHDRLTPVDEAHAAIAEISDGLDRLEAGLAKLRGRKSQALVVVTASQALMTNWLIPNLDGFSTRYPDIDIRLDVADRLIDLGSGEADIGVRCGTGLWAGVTSTRFMEEEIIAVCSPGLLDDVEDGTPNWLSKQTLIHDATRQPGIDIPTWDVWLAKAGLAQPRRRRGLNINSTSAVIQAAALGRGLALVRRTFVAQDLQRGRLRQAMFEHRWQLQMGYYVVSSARSLRRAEVRAFHDWLLDLPTSTARV